MSKITNKVKELRFRFPGKDLIAFGRYISCVKSGNELYATVRMEKNKKNYPFVLTENYGKRKCFEINNDGLCHRPVITVSEEGTASVLWNESVNGKWKIMHACKKEGERQVFGIGEEVFCGDLLSLPPHAVYGSDGRLHVVWSTETVSGIRVMYSVMDSAGSWLDPVALSGEGYDAFRPKLNVENGKATVVWDSYIDNRYIVECRYLENGSWSSLMSIEKEGERYFCPDIACTSNGEIYISWVVMREVSDCLGVTDHEVFGFCGKIKEKCIEPVCSDKLKDGEIVADMREGLLPENVSKGYLGLRRRSQLAATPDGGLICFWERRNESESTAVIGYLSGRRMDPDGKWSESFTLCREGYGYSIPKKTDSDSMSFAFFKFEETGADILRTATVSLSDAELIEEAPSRWSRWHKSCISIPEKDRTQIETNGEKLKMFWADTHCHSNFSADAEGEPDEIIHYARDIAGLDALCVIDNDYYPNKTLSEAEWNVHNAYSTHFSGNGRFVLFPGYEFTFHRKDLVPDFNHRCVIYPQAGGKLLRRIDTGSANDKELIGMLKDSGAMCYPHHCTYEIIDNEVDRNVEICSSWRVSMEESDFTMEQLKNGNKLGFIGSSDAHRSNPGLGGALTGIYSAELSPEALFDAYRRHRTIATQGFFMFADFRVGGHFIGDSAISDSSPEISFQVKTHGEIESVHVIRDGERIFSLNPAACEATEIFTDEKAGKGDHFYYLRVKLKGDESFNFVPDENAREPFTLNSRYPHNLARARGVFAWTSPVWMELK